VELSPEIGRLSPNVEISILHIVQECLTNVYRQSGRKAAYIKIAPSHETLLAVQVYDEGKGMPRVNGAPAPPGSNHGVGLSGMRERVLELGGTLENQSSESGTTVTAAVPVTKMMVKSV
jgi:two-component system sensor histidine kinase UhpB